MVNFFILDKHTLQPRQVCFFRVNPDRAPILEVTTVLVLVCSPLSNVDSAFASPRIGSKMRSKGLASMFVK